MRGGEGTTTKHIIFIIVFQERFDMQAWLRSILPTLLAVSFVVSAYAQAPARKGWWKFDDATNLLKAEPGFGSDLELVGSHQAIAGPVAGNGAVKIGIGSHYKMMHGIAANGGGSYVNEFSVQIDFRVASIGSWYTFFQTDPTNSSDGDCFINTSGKIGVGATGYSAYAISANEWYRLVISVNNGTHYRYYLDGQLLSDATAQDIDGRFALDSVLLLFGDNDGDDGEIDVAEVAIWDIPLTTYQIQSLGGFNHQLPKDPLQAAGRWKFDNPDNPVEGYYGKDLELVGTHEIVDGPVATNKAVRIGVGSFYRMDHGIAPNGGGAYVNEFSLQFDFRVADIGSWRAFFQTNPGNSNDADCFINDQGQIGVGSTGYSAYKVLPNEWYRLVISVKNGAFFKYYLEGQPLLDGGAQDVDGRYGLENLLLLFADNDGEDGLIDVAEVAIWDRALSETEMIQLGGYGHSISDTTGTTRRLVGKWKFDDASDLLKAELGLGLPLELVGTQQPVAGPASGNGAVKIGVGSHYKMTHGIGANGGGARVNEYSLQIDFKISELNIWHCFFQTDPANASDGDCFINPGGNIGVGATRYTDYAVLPNQWYRLVISVKNGTHYRYYLDGQLQLDGTFQAVDGRFALDNTLLMFADEDGEDGEIECAELAIWNYPLTDEEVAQLGGFQADSTAPAAPTGVAGVPDAIQKFNLVIWQDVPGENGEKYTVYASQKPITDLNAPEVEVLAEKIAENTQVFVHYLYYPLSDKPVSYYYAVTTADRAGNVGLPGVAAAATANTAKGIATISLNPPAQFVADGVLTEWENSGIKPFVLKKSTATLTSANGTFDNDEDLTATIYMAVDNQYLYLAADVIDNVFSYVPGGNWWEDDAIEMFIGLYDGRPGPPHDTRQRGARPDYSLQIRYDGLVNSDNNNRVIYNRDSTNYYFQGLGVADYVIETRIRLSDIRFGNDAPFVPVNGMRIPLDFSIHDSDAPNVRDGIMPLSPNNHDNSWQSPRNWTYTWIGDRESPTAVRDKNNDAVPLAYGLSQNYPNPFNPTTAINYSIRKTGLVKIELYNTLGQKVRTLVNEVKPAGTYRLEVRANDLTSGLYFYRISAGDFVQTRKMVLMK